MDNPISFTRYCVAAELLDRDPLTLAVAPDGDTGQGARAATLDEARAIIGERMP